MKTNWNTLATVSLALLLAACTNDELTDNPLADGPVALNVTAGINQATTRVSIDENNSASFTEGDQINVVADEEETYTYTLQGSSWSAIADPYYFQSSASVNFRAWYAVPDVTPTENAISINTQTQTIDATTGWNQWDILATPSVAASASNSTVNFTGDNAFQHVMSQVTITFQPGDGISNLTALSGYTLKSLTTDATFNTLTCELNAGSETGNVTANITDAAGTSYTCTPLILVPQTITGAIGLEVTYNNQTYEAYLTAPTNGLQPGSSYTYTVTVSNTGLTVGDAEISDWTLQTPINGNATLQ